MLTAFVRNSKIEMIKEVTLDEYALLAPPYEVAIDISDLIPAPQIGWDWDGRQFVNLTGIEPSRKITKLALRNRFTREEKVVLENTLAVSADLKAWYRDFEVATYIDLARPDTIAGITFLEDAHLIGVGRANEILNAPITIEEAW